MKIAMPMDEKELKTNVCPSFGRAPYFLIYNTETEESLFLDNSAIASQGGAGIKAAQTLADNDVKALLTPRCGQNAEEVLSKAEISIFKTIPGTAQQNIEAFKAEQLSVLNDIHPGFHGHER